MLKSFVKNVGSIIPRRTFSLTSIVERRKPPIEEYENNAMRTRKKTADPFDRRWKWTAKLAEPYNIRGGDMRWTQMKITHRGVQAPGYVDPLTKRFIFVKEMVPEIVVPNLEGCELKAYVPYNVKEIKSDVFTAKELYKKTLEKDLLFDLKQKQQQQQQQKK